MRYRTLGKSGISASVVGLGTWTDERWARDSTEEKNLIDAIHAAVDSGVNLIDTAPVYGLGFSEELVGKAIGGHRDNVVLATKCGLVWDTEKGTPLFHEKGRPVNRYLGAEFIRFELEESLRRLGTDRIDLYQVHVLDPDRPIEEPMLTLLDLKKQGKIRAVGICNAGLEQVQRFHAAGELDAVQLQYSLIDRRAEINLLPYCYNHDIAVLAYSPLLQALLGGAIGHDQKYAVEGLAGGASRTNPETLQAVTDTLNELRSVAYRYGLTLPQIAIAWTAQSPGITHVLAGATVIGQAQIIANAADASLSEDDVTKINAAMESVLATHAT